MNQQPGDLYWYRALVTQVIDGDTIDVSLDLGCRVWLQDRRVRLLGINAPELKQPTLNEGRKAKLWLINRLLAKTVTIRTHKDADDKYGRLLGEIWIGQFCINREMIDLGLAKPYGKNDMELAS